MRDVLKRLARMALIATLGWYIGLSATRAADRTSSYTAALESITAQGLQHYVNILADEAMEGREAGTRGGWAAADYLAAELANSKIRGGGDEGGYFQPFPPNFRNVLGRIEGSDLALKQQYIVLGAHYDHIGRGNYRNSRGGVGQIHPGADDNASGVSGLLKLAQAFVLLPEPPRRSLLFAFWDAEELEMLGSRYWMANPTVPREHLVMAFNLDMIGRLRQDRVIILGSRTSFGFRRLVCQQNGQSNLLLDFSWKLLPAGDHFTFLQAGVPHLMFHTDVHDDYHRPADVARLVNSAGMERVVRLVFAVAYEIAQQAQAPKFRAAARYESPETQQVLLQPYGPLPDRFGAAWEQVGVPGFGVRLTWVGFGSPAYKAGFQPGDQIVQFAGRRITSAEDLMGAIIGASSPAVALVYRPGRQEPLELTVQLEGPPLRLGITWRTDDAEPGTIILTQVVPGSPAAHAGLRVGDRIYQIGGRDFADDREFAQRAKSLPGPLRVLMERDGRIRTVEIPLEAHFPLRRAA